MYPLLILHPPLEEAQEVNTEATAIASTRIKIDFFILFEVFKVKRWIAWLKKEMGPGNSEEGSGIK
jgi:hypothetical protein